jgi:hypothetical protein
MNEQIKQLALAAGGSHYPDVGGRTLEKFAELLIQECVAICQNTDGEDNVDARSGRQDCAVEIREHFGVES